MECHSLGVKTWVNGYRSEDYVGRALWLLEGEEYWRTTYQPAEGEYREFCVGVGAILTILTKEMVRLPSC